MKKIISTIVVFFSLYTLANADEWKTQNKWKISCGLTDKEALVINGKPKKNYNKNSFKINSAVFKLDKGEIGKCKSDKKPTGGYKYSGRQEITHKLSPGFTIFEANIQPDGAPQYRSHFFQIHDNIGTITRFSSSNQA